MVFILVCLSGDGSSFAATVIFLLASLTDFLDGQLARRTGSVSETGKILDPLADRILIGAAVIALTIKGLLPVAGVALVVSRDIVLLFGYKLLERRGVVVRVSRLGKSYTAILLAAIVAVMAGFAPGGYDIGLWLFWVGVTGSLLSGALYVMEGVSRLRAERIRPGG